MNRRIWVAALVVVALGGVLWASLGSSDGKGKVVQIEPVARRAVVARVKASGGVNPKRKVEIQSKVIGEITSLPVREGDAVKAGQVVLEIEKELYLAARDQARAALDQATVAAERARAEAALETVSHNRVASLQAEGVLTEDALDRARLSRDSAAIAVRSQEEVIAQARSAYRRAVEDLERTTIRSPIDGIVTVLNVEQGETAIVGTMNFSGSVLMVIGDLSELLAEVEVTESQVVNLSLDQDAVVRIDALPELSLVGHVVEIGSSGVKTGDVVRFRVKVLLASPDPRVRPGMTAKVEITTAQAADALAVPQQAVQTRWLDAKGREVKRREGDTSQREVRAVYVRQGGKAVRREVKTGVQDELWAEITDGVAENDDVITGPYRVLRELEDGDAVRVEEKPAKKRAKSGGTEKESGSAD